jgi:hypothetical protein
MTRGESGFQSESDIPAMIIHLPWRMTSQLNEEVEPVGRLDRKIPIRVPCFADCSCEMEGFVSSY